MRECVTVRVCGPAVLQRQPAVVEDDREYKAEDQPTSQQDVLEILPPERLAQPDRLLLELARLRVDPLRFVHKKLEMLTSVHHRLDVLTHHLGHLWEVWWGVVGRGRAWRELMAHGRADARARGFCGACTHIREVILDAVDLVHAALRRAGGRGSDGGRNLRREGVGSGVRRAGMVAAVRVHSVSSRRSSIGPCRTLTASASS